MAIQSFDHNQIRALSSVLANTVTHNEMSDYFRHLSIDDLGSGAKHSRLAAAFEKRQERDRCGNIVGTFIETVLAPIRYLNDKARYDELRHQVNEVLSFNALHVNDLGKLAKVEIATTISEARERAGRLRSSLESRRVHHDVLLFCKEELLYENYFHAVFEATKSVAEKIRERSGCNQDGAELVDKVFSTKRPILVMNTLRTETELSEQIGLANMLKGIFGMFRNTTAHIPKIKWVIEEQDALDLLTMVSYLHRCVEKCVKVPTLE